MQDITGLSMSSTDFPTFRCQEIDIGMATGIRAISVTHCGELGWVMYIPNEVTKFGDYYLERKNYGRWVV